MIADEADAIGKMADEVDRFLSGGEAGGASLRETAQKYSLEKSTEKLLRVCEASRRNRTRSILIVKPSSLGDIVHAMPAVCAIRKKFPESRISWVIKKKFASILEDNDCVDEIIPYEGAAGFLRTLLLLRQRGFDMAVDLQGLLRSGIFSFASGAGVRAGFANAREMSHLFLNRKVVTDRQTHGISRCMEIVRDLGADTEEIDYGMGIDAQVRQGVLESLRAGGLEEGARFVLVNHSARWLTKRWGSSRYAELCRSIYAETGIKCVLSGDDTETGPAAEIKRGCPDGVVDLAGKISLRGLPALAAEAAVVVTNDTGPMHIAAAVNTQVVAVFGPTDPKLTGPYGRGHTVLRKELRCAPCFEEDCTGMECMEAVSVKEVFEAVKEKL